MFIKYAALNTTEKRTLPHKGTLKEYPYELFKEKLTGSHQLSFVLFGAVHFITCRVKITPSNKKHIN